VQPPAAKSPHHPQVPAERQQLHTRPAVRRSRRPPAHAVAGAPEKCRVMGGVCPPKRGQAPSSAQSSLRHIKAAARGDTRSHTPHDRQRQRQRRRRRRRRRQGSRAPKTQNPPHL